jgi:hypothetical protein
MSKRAIVVLALVAAVLLGYVALFERGSATSKELSQRSTRVLVSFVREKVDRLEIQRLGRTVVLTRKPNEEGELGGWKILAPVASEADEDAVNQVLGELEWLTAQRTLEDIDADDEKRFGLTAPRARVAFQIGRKRHVLAIGAQDVHGESVYTRVDGEKRAYVVPRALLETLANEPGYYRDKQLFPTLTIAWAQKVELTKSGTRGELTRQDERWWLELAPRGYADDKRVTALLDALSSLRASRYLEGEAAKRAEAALAQPTQRIAITIVPEESREDQAARRLTLELGGKCEEHEGERYARAIAEPAPSGPFVCVRQADLSALDLPATDLRDARLFASEVSAIERVELTRGAHKLVLARAGADWKSDSEVPTDREAVEAWLADLAAARSVDFASLERFEERGSLTLVSAGDKRERIALSDLTSSDELLARRAEEPLLVRFSAGVFDRLLPSAARYRSLELWAAHQPSEVVRVDVRAGARARTLALEGSWRSRGGEPIDDGRVRELVRELVDVRAQSFVSEQARPAHGLAQVTRRVELGLNSAGPLALELGASTERGVYARVDGRAIVELSPATVALIDELAGGPRPPAPAQPSAPELEERDEDEEHEHAH